MPGWYYPAPAAYVFAGGVGALGERGTLLGVRLLNLVSAAALFTTAGSAVAQGLRRPGLTPLCSEGLFLHWKTSSLFGYGNVSGLLVGILVLAVLIRSLGPRIGWLSLGFLFKPFALGRVLSRPLRQAVLPEAWPHSSMVLLLLWAFAARHQLDRWEPGRPRWPVVTLVLAFGGIRGLSPIVPWLERLSVDLPLAVGVQLGAAVSPPLAVLITALLVADPPWAVPVTAEASD